MPSILPARAIVSPSFIEPELIVTTSQASAFPILLGGRGPTVKLGPVDKAIIMNAIDLRTGVHAQQATHNMLPAPTIVGQMLSTATYMARNRADWSEFDEMEAGTWGVALPAAYELAMDQGIFQFLRTAALYGVTPANGEGLMNTPNATAVNLPADTFGNTTLLTYDNGQLALFIQNQVQQALSRLFMMGSPARIVMLGPQRTLGYMQMTAVVQTTSYQRPGAGTATVLQMAKTIVEEFGYEFEVGYDDTLIGKGAGGSDAIILVIPEIIVQTNRSINTNEFASLTPNQRRTTMLYTDMIRPRRIRTPIPEGVDVTSSLRTSSGWAPRGQAVTIISIPYP